MFTISKTFHFEASHQLMHHDGKCARLHGHSWEFTVEFEGATLNATGPKENMLVDYGDISAVIKPIIESKLDHYHLNATLGTDSPTSEFLANWLWLEIRSVIFTGFPPYATLKAVTVKETCTSACRFEG